MKENEAFQFIGNMPQFEDLLRDVLCLKDKDWSEYIERKRVGGLAAENTETIPLVYDTKHRLDSGVLHKNYEIFSKYIDEVIFVMMKNNAELKVQQAMLTRLKSGTVIPSHRDKGPLTAKTHRIHVPVTTNNECVFTVGDESKRLEVGQIWIIDNVGRYHSVENKGSSHRVHLIVDVC